MSSKMLSTAFGLLVILSLGTAAHANDPAPASAGAVTLAQLAAPTTQPAPAASEPSSAPPAAATTPPPETKPAPDPLAARREGNDMVMGKADAPVTIIEYASLTCPHCANFHVTTLPRLKSEYVDRGLVRFIYRDFPLDRLALTAALLPHCAGPSRYFGMLEVLFRQQMSWARASDPVQALSSLARLGGMSNDAIQACLADQQIMNQVLATSLQGEREFQIRSTPSLVINGKTHTGALTFEELDKVLRPLTAGKS